MFDFQHLWRYAALPRPEKAVHLLLALLLLATLPLGCRVITRLYGEYGSRRPTLRQQAVASLTAETEVICVGNSHVMVGIRPSLYHVKLMNLATSALSYRGAESVIAGNLHRLPGLKLAVLELDELMANIDMMDRLHGEVMSLLELGVRPRDLPASKPREQAELFLRGTLYPLFMLPRATPYDWMNLRPTQESGQWEPGFAFMTATIRNNRAAAGRMKLLQTSARAAAPDEVAAFRRIIKKLRARRVRVLLLRMPHHSSYARSRSPLFAQRLNELKLQTKEQFGNDSGVMLCDLESAPGFTDNDFYDCDHLNVDGAAKLARALDPQLTALMREGAR